MSPATAMSKTRRAGSILLLFFAFFVNQVACKGRKGGGRVGGGGGSSSGGSSSSLNLPPGLTAIFAITVIIAIVTLYQLGRAIPRLKKPILPQGAPTLPYDVGKLFPVLLFTHLLLYLLYNILYAALIALRYNRPTPGLGPAVAFIGQVADVLLFSMILCIIAYRQRIQFNPSEKRFNLKSFLDGWLLSTILVIGIAKDAIEGAGYSDPFMDPYAYPNLAITYQIFMFITSIDVAVTAIMAYNRFKAAGIQDNIIRSAAFFVTPFILIGGLYRLVDGAMNRSALAPRKVNSFGSISGPAIDLQTLLIANTVILGIVAIAVASFALLMGALPKPAKGNHKSVESGSEKA